jgi:hypothetical protein
MGVLSLPLMLWDAHNARVIESMGMTWDTGAPIWPYQTSDILLRLLNGPAYFITMPLANIFRLAAPTHHLLVFPAILIWWWFLGLRLDHGLVRTKLRWRWPAFMALVAFATLLLWAAAVVSRDAFSWWFEYGRDSKGESTLLMVRFLSPALWCVALTVLFVVAARRVATR